MNIRKKEAKFSINHIIIICGLAGIVCLSGCSSMAQKGAMSGAQRSIDKGDYQSALGRLTRGESHTTPTPEVGAKICYMKGICYEGLNKPDAAKAMFQFVVDNYADTTYGYLAKAKLDYTKKERG